MRLLGAAINLKTMEWLGPTSDKAVAKDFSNKFHRSTNVSGDVFMLAQQSERHAEYCRLAAEKGHHITPDMIDTINPDELLRMILPPGGMQRYKAWMASFNENASLGGTMLFDSDHNADQKGSTAGTDWPVNLRHGKVFAAKKTQQGCVWTLGLPFEHLSAMGFHMYPEMAGKWGLSVLHGLLQDLSPCQMQGLTGNGMHLVTQASWMMYVLSNVSAKNDKFDIAAPKPTSSE